MWLARFAFQACLIDRSSISPFRINNLPSLANYDHHDCDKSFNVRRSLTGASSIAVGAVWRPHSLMYSGDLLKRNAFATSTSPDAGAMDVELMSDTHIGYRLSSIPWRLRAWCSGKVDAVRQLLRATRRDWYEIR